MLYSQVSNVEMEGESARPITVQLATRWAVAWAVPFFLGFACAMAFVLAFTSISLSPAQKVHEKILPLTPTGSASLSSSTSESATSTPSTSMSPSVTPSYVVPSTSPSPTTTPSQPSYFDKIEAKHPMQFRMMDTHTYTDSCEYETNLVITAVINRFLEGTNLTAVCGECMEDAHMVVFGDWGGKPNCDPRTYAKVPYQISYTGEAYPTHELYGVPKIFAITGGGPDGGMSSTIPFFYSIFAHYMKPGDTDLRRFHNLDRPYAVAYVSRHCVPHREHFFRLLVDRLGPNLVRSYGGCQHSPGLPHVSGDYRSLDLYELISKHAFYISMENTIAEGYVTEKILNGFRGGAVPIYYGHQPTVNKYFNPKAFIFSNAFPSLEAVADHVRDLYHDKKRLHKMMQEPVWRDGKVPRVEDEPAVIRASEVLKDVYKDLLR